jgi:hypothetical protein
LTSRCSLTSGTRARRSSYPRTRCSTLASPLIARPRSATSAAVRWPEDKARMSCGSPWRTRSGAAAVPSRCKPSRRISRSRRDCRRCGARSIPVVRRGRGVAAQALSATHCHAAYTVAQGKVTRRCWHHGGDEQFRFPPLSCHRHPTSGHALPDLPPHGRVPARHHQRGADQALPPGPPRNARPPVPVAGPAERPSREPSLRDHGDFAAKLGPRTPAAGWAAPWGLHHAQLGTSRRLRIWPTSGHRRVRLLR